MKCSVKCRVLILAVTISAMALRLPRLAQRPMHTDEATGAVKFGELLENNFYRYDSSEHHGPTLNYFTLIGAWLASVQKFSNINEFTLRIVPVFFSLLLIMLHLFLADGLGSPVAVFAAVLTAISPAFVYYSRYYIHEMLLICFTFGLITAGYRYSHNKNVFWALLAGLFCGLIYATKETCIIIFGSILIALLLVCLFDQRQKDVVFNTIKVIKPLHAIVFAAAAVITSILFYSSFFSNPAGIIDSLCAYIHYFTKAGLQDQPHAHQWYYYLKMLIYSRYGTGPVWTEGLIVILTIIGFVVVLTRKTVTSINLCLIRFIAFYTLIITIIYSIIPYKTPWCMLGFLHAMILLAAFGAASLIKLASTFHSRIIVTILLVAACAHLAWQGWRASYSFCADPRNPYVYAHTSPDIFDMTKRIEEIAAIHPDNRDMYIQIICVEDDYWPFPWYLRSFSKVSYLSEVTGDLPNASLIIASASLELELMRTLYELPPPGQRNLYVDLFDSYMQLRPQIELRGYITKDLWDHYQQHRSRL